MLDGVGVGVGWGRGGSVRETNITTQNGTDDLLHSIFPRYFTQNFTFAFAFVVQNVINEFGKQVLWVRVLLWRISGNRPFPYNLFGSLGSGPGT